MLPIAIVHNDESVPAGLLADSLALRRVQTEAIKAYAGEPMPALTEVAGVVVLGGHMGAYEDEAHPFLKQEKELIRAAVRQGIPLLGICLGCQLMADALGGRAYRVDPQEGGLVDVHLSDAGRVDPVLGRFEGPIVSWHHDSWDLPPRGSLLAFSDQYPQAFRMGSAVGVQFHPEVTPTILKGWLDRDGDSLDEIGVDPDLFLAEVEGAESSLQARADRLFGAWIEEVVRSAG